MQTTAQHPTKKGFRLALALFLMMAMIISATMTAYAANDSPYPNVLVHSTGTEQVRTFTATIDTSNTQLGYVMCSYNGKKDKALVQVKKNGSSKLYDFYIGTDGEFEAIPFFQGNGQYRVTVFEHHGNDHYFAAAETVVDVELENGFFPFLYPNQTVWFTAEMEAVAKGAELTAEAQTTPEKIEAVFNYLVENIEYDYELAERDRTGYRSNADNTLKTGKGICLDYAVLGAAMLRSQGIPTKVQCGKMADGSLHAWLSVYSREAGMVGPFEVKEKGWTILDPTYAANSMPTAIAMILLADQSEDYQLMYNF